MQLAPSLGEHGADLQFEKLASVRIWRKDWLILANLNITQPVIVVNLVCCLRPPTQFLQGQRRPPQE